MNTEELENILRLHKMWLNGNENGVRANLSYANLGGSDLRDADLSYANLNYVNLSEANLSYANLSSANLSYANLSSANLSDADLGGSDLSGADLSYANLSSANLSYADLYMTTWPLWCGSKNARIDISIASQLAAHFCCLRCDDPEYQKAKEALLPLAKKFKYAGDLGL